VIDKFCLWFFGWIDNQVQAIENLYDLDWISKKPKKKKK
jgi:hypothetical protein